MAKLGSDKAKTHQTTAYISLGTMDIKIKGTQGRLYVLSVEFCPHSIAYHHRISCSISHFGVSRVSRASTSVSAKETFWRFDRLSPCLMPKLFGHPSDIIMPDSKRSYDAESDLKDIELSRTITTTSEAPYTPALGRGEGRSIFLDASAPYPHRGRTRHRTLTIQENLTQGTIKDGQPGQRDRNLEIQRTNSISLATGPMKGDRDARTVADFRTLSLGVKDTQRSEELGNAQRRGKKEVKGPPSVAISASLFWHWD